MLPPVPQVRVNGLPHLLRVYLQLRCYLCHDCLLAPRQVRRRVFGRHDLRDGRVDAVLQGVARLFVILLQLCPLGTAASIPAWHGEPNA